jgi:transcriptional regulator with XRE-family HTH domain
VNIPMRIESVQGVKWRGAVVYDRAMAITLRTFGERVTWLLVRPEHGDGKSQKELAAAMDISEQFLSALIKGRRRPNVRHLQAAAKALNTSVSFLALTTDDPSPEIAEAGPIYLSPQADTAAQLMDAMRDDDWRNLALQLVRLVAMHAGVRDTDVTGVTDAATAASIDKLFDKAFRLGSHITQPSGGKRGV